ncbi:hypothetical protein [Litorivita sp. NS0012-18]|uniref:hypothetical protein n=1 Tax=Litorivita sp. NS0012-18 TaxID=3127655 RepID=UPI0033424A2F
MTEQQQIKDGLARIYALFEAQMHIDARPLGRAVARAGRRLPKAARHAGRRLAQIEPLLDNPKLWMQVDQPRAGKDMAQLRAALLAYDRRARRIHALLGWATSNMVNLFVIIAALVALLRWRGLL